jgi:hypothetical protein
MRLGERYCFGIFEAIAVLRFRGDAELLDWGVGWRIKRTRKADRCWRVEIRLPFVNCDLRMECTLQMWRSVHDLCMLLC